jgi:hypothetical protein
VEENAATGNTEVEEVEEIDEADKADKADKAEEGLSCMCKLTWPVLSM